MNTEKILVTGSTGFVGSHLCEKLIKKGCSVRALVRNTSRFSDLHHLGVEVVKGDLRDPDSLRVAVKGINVVYHIAAIFRQENISRKEMWEINVQGTRNILDAAVNGGVQRFVHCSTIGVHGDIKEPPANEDTPYGPGDHYQESKTDGERVVLKYMAEGRLPVVVFRPGGIYGPRDLRFLKLFKAIKNRRFVMFGSGEVIYQMIYIDDLIQGVLLCGTEDKAVGNIYILTGEEPTTLNQIVRVIAEIVDVTPPRLHFPVIPIYIISFLCELVFKPLGINPPLYRRRVDFFRKTRAFDISKAKSELGFQPRIDLKTGIRLTADWYQEKGYL
ncbi:MAG: NAD-dependent epimerase/dehydratase family protein [Nitrospirota bacterium]